jgi:glycosyltransferase involved in cell wall biosynthesis
MVLPSYLPEVGGVAMHVAEVAPRLLRAGVDVEILATDRSGLLPEHEIIDGVPVHRVRSYPSRRDYYIAPGLIRALSGRRWDIVHCQGIQTFVPPLGMFVAARRHLPYLVTFHTGGHSSTLRTRLRGLQWLALVPLLRRADRLIAVSQFEADVFGRLPGLASRRIDVISNGAAPSDPDQSVRVDHDLILSVGRLERYKGHQHAIDALPEMLRHRPDLHLRIAGTGTYAGELAARAQRLGVASHVEIRAVPPSDRSGMAGLMARAAVVVLLSDFEAQPLALMEALALGRPVVATDATGIHEFVARGLVRGVSLGAPTADVARAILGALDAPAAVPVALPTWDECAARVLAVYRAIAAGDDRLP